MKFYLDPRLSKDGRQSIVIRGRDASGQPYRIFVTGVFPTAKIQGNNWKQREQKVTGNPGLNETLKQIKTKLENQVLTKKVLTPLYDIPNAWNDLFKPRKESPKTEAFPEKVVQAIPVYKKFFAGKKSAGYLRLLDQLETDLKAWNQDIVFSKLNFLALESFRSYLMGADGKRSKVLEGSTIYSRYKYLREVATLASRHGITVDQSIYDFKVKYIHKSGGFALTFPELMKIFHFKTSDKTMAAVRDYFLLEAFTGIRNSDCKDLRNASIHPDFIQYQDRKNNDIVKTVTRHQFNNAIIARYFSPAEPSQFLLPSLAQQTINEYLKTIAKECGLDRLIFFGGEMRPIHECISTHVGRHTYATLLNQLGIQPDYIKEEIGHSQGLTFGTYVHRHDRYEVIREAMNSLPMDPVQASELKRLRKAV